MKNKYRSEFTARQQMLKDSYEIYYYSDSHFQSVSPHRHDYYEFYFPVSGSIEMEISGRRTPLSEHDAVLVPPGTVHRAVNESGEKSYSRYVFWISADYYRQLSRSAGGISYAVEQAEKKHRFIHHFSENEYAVIRSRILRLIEEENSSRFAREDCISLCISDLLLTLSRLVYEHDHPRPEAEPFDTVQTVMDHIVSHLDEELTLDALSEQFFISKYHLARLFQKRTGMTLPRYIQKKRLERCADEIRAGRSVTKVYRDYGFGDYSSFFRAFRKEFMRSPREYQNLNRHNMNRSREENKS